MENCFYLQDEVCCSFEWYSYCCGDIFRTLWSWKESVAETSRSGTQIEYLGFVLSSESVCPIDKNIKVVKQLGRDGVTPYLLLLPAAKNISLQLHIT